MITVVALVWLCSAGGARQIVSDDEAVRRVVQEYFDAEEREDPDRVLGLWSAEGAGRPTRSELAAVFASGDDKYTVTIQAVTVKGSEAHVRVSAARARTIPRDTALVIRTSAVTSFGLTRETDGWKIVSERPAAEEIVDEILTASPADRDKLITDPSNAVPPVIQALSSRASRLAIGGQYAAAQGLLEIALAAARVAHDQRAEGETLQNLANTFYFQREYEKAGEFYQQRLTLARAAQDQEAIAASLIGVATSQYARGDYSTALASYREALGIYELRNATASIGSALLSIGNVQFMQAEYDAATASYRRAMTLLESASDRNGVAMARGGLGRVFTAQGDLAAALEMYTSILTEIRASSPAGGSSVADLASTLESIGELQYRLGNVDQARAAFDEARRLSDDRGDLPTAGLLFANLGLTELAAEKADAALADYVESRSRFDAARLPEGVARAWMGIGFSQAARAKYPEAIAAYRTAIAAFETQHLPEEQARGWLGLSFAQSDSGDRAAALESAHRSREIGDSLSNNELRWRGRVREGEALRGLGRLDEAQRVFEDAIGLVRSLTPDAASSAETRTQLDETASAWAGLAFTLAQRGDAVGALAAEEQRRAHIRQLFLAPFERDIVVGSTTADQEAERATMRDLIGARAKLRAERASRHPDAARMDDLRRQVTALSKARVDQQTALYARVPDLALWRGLQPAPQAADLNGLIPPGMLVVEFLVSEEQVLLLSAVHGDTAPDVAATIVPIKKPDLTTAIGQALDTQSLDDAAVWRKRSASLADVLVKPIASRLAGRDRVILLPDDVLWKIPFEALANGEADLATRATVTYATSLTTLAAQRRNAEPPPVSTSSPPAASTTSPQVVRPAFAAVAGPAIAPLLQAQLAVSTPGWTPPDPASSIGSSQRLAALYGEGSKVVVGGDSTKPAVRALLASADVLDLAAPLQMNGVNPLFTVVLLAPDTSSDDSGRWEVREWFAEHARARVLSVPDGTTSGGARAGAALDAMAWASAAAGVSTIAIGRWPSNGYAIDAVLSSFHEALAKSTRPADALRRAISSAKANKDDESPGAWAGLRLIGW